MAMLKMSDKRLPADLLVRTKELQHVLEDWLRGHGSQDVWKSLGLGSIKRVDCKETAERCFGVYSKDYRRINWTGQDDSDFLDKADTGLRSYASWVKEFALKDDAHMRFCRRVSLKETATVDSLLSLMDIDTAGDKTSASTCLELVPYKRVASERASASKEAPFVFKRILSRKMSARIPLQNKVDSPFPVRFNVDSAAVSASTRPMEDENVKPG
eukprot:s4800_g1.t1